VWIHLGPDGDSINLYYGAAACAIALAQGSVRALLEWLEANGGCERPAAKRRTDG